MASKPCLTPETLSDKGFVYYTVVFLFTVAECVYNKILNMYKKKKKEESVTKYVEK